MMYMHMQVRKLIVLLALALMVPVGAVAVEAGKARDIVSEAREIIDDVMSSSDKSVPRDLLRKAAGIAIFPGVVKAGFIVGGKYGRGVVLRHNKHRNTWTAPAFYSVGAGSVGWQIGVQSTDLILLIRSERGMKSLLKSEFTLGADASIAAGPVGGKATAATDIRFTAEIMSYSRSRGLFAGVSLEGAKLNSREDYNKAYYGKSLTARDILFEGRVLAPRSGTRLVLSLQKYSK